MYISLSEALDNEKKEKIKGDLSEKYPSVVISFFS